MRKNTAFLIFVFLFLIQFTIPCAASDSIIKINDLIDRSVSLDNTEVTVQGEIIGEVLERGEYSWININDGANAIGIWLETSDTNQIKHFGDYKHKGDTVIITGIFYKACPDHGGDVDIHCNDIKLVENGYAVKTQIPVFKIITAILLLAVAFVIFGLYKKISKSPDNKKP